ncbi:MAG: FAD-linked oxidase C-terminal domain-containing protein [Candidatus Electrothrix aestuarii]|uniref:FAD-linked oxidase C-terminal domain-containing protein n=1 Tax=Candidatus Electrothrix aestuarii TaxID=3062594 RepID=A0AAU8LQW7_9BACT|nr:FAD-linked oxidase C-terminal domain-containing protein [Candidatus Electrothrix aestuarii]
MEKKIIKKIQQAIGKANLLTSLEERSCYSYDASGRNFMPDAVALPETTEQVAVLLRLANEYRFPVIPRGAGSGTTGGALPVQGGLVVGFSRMKRIVEIDPENMIAVVEPGVVTGELQTAVKKHGLMYPPDPASLKFCSIGGNAGECAGGPSAVKYGVTRDYIIGLEVVLPTGEIMRTGVRTEKGVVGYDLTRLFIGSEGTLALFTKLILRLLPLAEAKATFLLSFSSLAQATGLVAKILTAGLMPCTLEYMDQTAVQVVRDRLTHPLPEETKALLLVEFDGDADEVGKEGARFVDFVQEQNNTDRMSDCMLMLRQAQNEAETQELWLARRSIAPACLSLRPHKIAEDVVVPRSRIPDLVQLTEQLAEELRLIILTFGHAGDGNIHVNIMVDKQNEQEYSNGLKAKERLFERVLAIGGTLSGEHGVGITKSPFLAQELDETALSVMRKLKGLFDPHNILNPGKIFPV